MEQPVEIENEQVKQLIELPQRRPRGRPALSSDPEQIARHKREYFRLYYQKNRDHIIQTQLSRKAQK